MQGGGTSNNGFVSHKKYRQSSLCLGKQHVTVLQGWFDLMGMKAMNVFCRPSSIVNMRRVEPDWSSVMSSLTGTFCGLTRNNFHFTFFTWSQWLTQGTLHKSTTYDYSEHGISLTYFLGKRAECEGAGLPILDSRNGNKMTSMCQKTRVTPAFRSLFWHRASPCRSTGWNRFLLQQDSRCGCMFPDWKRFHVGPVIFTWSLAEVILDWRFTWPDWFGV